MTQRDALKRMKPGDPGKLPVDVAVVDRIHNAWCALGALHRLLAESSDEGRHDVYNLLKPVMAEFDLAMEDMPILDCSKE